VKHFSMASASSTAFAFSLPSLNSSGLVKLDGPNYLSWSTQFLPALRAHDLVSIVDGTEVCPPEYLVDVEGKPTSDRNP
jgi:hypothetical protein